MANQTPVLPKLLFELIKSGALTIEQAVEVNLVDRIGYNDDEQMRVLAESELEVLTLTAQGYTRNEDGSWS